MLKITEAFNKEDVEIIQLDENDLNENDTVILTGFGAVQVNFEYNMYNFVWCVHIDTHKIISLAFLLYQMFAHNNLVLIINFSVVFFY